MEQKLILWPAVAMVVVIYGIWFTIFAIRIAQYKKTAILTPWLSSNESADPAKTNNWRPANAPSATLYSLFEMPVLLFVVLTMLFVTHTANIYQLTLAWLFVATRATHTTLQITGCAHLWRYIFYCISSAILLIMWVGFTVDALLT